jgi:hypothetical protein
VYGQTTVTGESTPLYLFDPPVTRPAGKVAYEPMDPTTRRRLQEFFAPHNERLYDLLGTDFGW